MEKVKKFNEYFNADTDITGKPLLPTESFPLRYKVGVIDNVIEKNGNNDMDYVFENKNGSILNIQFDTDGNRHEMTYSTSDDFLKKINHPALKNYRDFYNQVFHINLDPPFNKQLDGFFNFVGVADGNNINN